MLAVARKAARNAQRRMGKNAVCAALVVPTLSMTASWLSRLGKWAAVVGVSCGALMGGVSVQSARL